MRIRAIALLCPSLVIPSIASAQELLTNPSFETAEEVCGFPATYEDWAVDAATIVGAEAGVTPLDGSSMLRMEYTFFDDGGAQCVGVGGGASSDIAQLVDVGSCFPAGTSATLQLSAHFTKSTDGDATDFNCIVRAYSGDPSTFATGATLLDENATNVTATSTAWVRCETTLTLPATTGFAAAYITATSGGGTTREIYADATSLVPIEGRCGFDCTAASSTTTACPDQGSPAEADICDTSTGACVECLIANDCDDGNECTDDSCSGGTCTSTPTADGATCAGGTCQSGTCQMTGMDAGVETDAELPLDAGLIDTGAPDSGAADTGAPDTGTPDTGTTDSGTRPGGDAGTVADGGDLEDADEGCSCSSARQSRSSTTFFVLALSLLLFRRRR